MTSQKPFRKQFGIYLDPELWKQFKIYCIQTNQKPHYILEDFLTNFLKEQFPTKKTPA